MFKFPFDAISRLFHGFAKSDIEMEMDGNALFADEL